MMEFYPANSSVPSEKRTSRLLLRPLRATDVEIDYEAVMSSREQLRRWSQTTWPTDDFTLAENLADLQRHEREHEQREAFTFTVLNPEGTICLGCVYIIPLRADMEQVCAEARYTARVGFWVRTSEIANDLDRHLLDTLRDWFTTRSAWRFDCVMFIVSQQDARQAAILSEAGLTQRLSFNHQSDKRPCWLYG